MLGTNSIKRWIKQFVQWNITDHLECYTDELLYQQLFAQKCSLLGLRNDFYPVGSAANYGLLYLLGRILSEQKALSILELGSGETTRLIDQLRDDDATHVCLEDDATWHTRISPRLRRCDYRLRPLVSRTIEGRPCLTYPDLSVERFDLLVVDGPHETEDRSRIGCLEPIRENTNQDFVIILDDCERKGERQTRAFIEMALRQKGATFRYRELRAKKTQGVFAAGRFDEVLFYW